MIVKCSLYNYLNDEPGKHSPLDRLCIENYKSTDGKIMLLIGETKALVSIEELKKAIYVCEVRQHDLEEDPWRE